MHKRVLKKRIRVYAPILAVVCFMVGFFVVRYVHRHHFVAGATLSSVTISLNGQEFIVHDVSSGSVIDVLENAGISLRDDDRVFPPREAQVYAYDIIHVEPLHVVHIQVDGEEQELQTYTDDLQHVLARHDISLDENDIVQPDNAEIIRNDMDIQIIRVEYREEVDEEKIAFDNIEKEDDEVSFRKRYTEQEGEYGIKQLTYRVAYHDGEEVDRELINTEITKDPVDEIIVQGTYVKLGESHTGACSWYAYTGTLSAANPWLPMGSYVKVTNVDNGKSVIVQINDRGPFVAGRIIDLDKVAFQEIASLGAGVINVKMEEIEN